MLYPVVVVIATINIIIKYNSKYDADILNAIENFNLFNTLINNFNIILNGNNIINITDLINSFKTSNNVLFLTILFPSPGK